MGARKLFSDTPSWKGAPTIRARLLDCVPTLAPLRRYMLTVLRLDGMIAVHSVRAVFTALAGVDGVKQADVKLGHAEIEHDAPLDLESVRAALESVGVQLLDATLERRRLGVLNEEEDSPDA